MTILLQRGGQLDGVATSLVKAAAQTLWRVNRARLWDLAVALGAPEDVVEPLWRRLISAGCIEQLGDDWRPTLGMHQLSTARIGSPLKRSRAEKLLAEMIRRAEEVNASSTEAAYYVTKIAVFGSYVTSEKDELGDLDVAWSLIERPEFDGWVTRMICSNQDPRSHMRRLVRPQHAALRLIDMGTMLDLNCQFREVFRATGPNIEAALQARQSRREEFLASQAAMHESFASLFQR